MRALSALRAPVDAFFTAVTVNADDPALRLNRLRLLSGLRDAVHTVADFSRIGGSRRRDGPPDLVSPTEARAQRRSRGRDLIQPRAARAAR